MLTKRFVNVIYCIKILTKLDSTSSSLWIKPIIYFLAFWTLLNGFQSYMTELANDEAYYWVYAQELAWGYFDHPAMVAVFSGVGYLLLENELGVRLLTILSSSLVLLLIWSLTDRKDWKVFIAIISSSFLVHVGGFMIAPDTPLLFFTALFYVLYKRYTERDSWILALGLGLCIAAMGNSKYPGAILVMAVFLSNLKLLKRWSFWLLPPITILGLIPHLYWQYANDFVTFRFQLFDRSRQAYTYLNIPDYIGGQLLVIGPLISLFLFWAAYRYKAKNDFERGLKWSVWGVWGFFLFSSFKGKIEANWTSAAFIPLFLLGYAYVQERVQTRKWMFCLAVPSVIFIALFRSYLMIDFLPSSWNQRNEFHGWDQWSEALAKEVNNQPVVFINDYKRSSLYRFYTGNKAYSFNAVSYAGDLYGLQYHLEEELIGQDVKLLKSWKQEGEQYSFDIQGFKDYEAYSRVKIDIKNFPKKVQPNQVYNLDLEISNPSQSTIELQDSIPILAYIFEHKKAVWDSTVIYLAPQELVTTQKITKQAVFRAPALAGEYRLRYACFAPSTGLISRNGHFYKFDVEK